MQMPRLLATTMRLSRRHLVPFVEARSGLAALEFALILPAMLVIYIGGVEVNDAVSIRRKVNHATSTFGDLAAQSSATVSATDLADYFKAASAILGPYDTTLFKSAVIGVALDSNAKATVAWAQAYNGAACPAKGSAVTLPAKLATANTFLVMVNSSYVYTPKIGYVLTGSYTMNDSVVQQPRLGYALTGPTC